MSPSACWAVIPAGGTGSRFSSTQNKLLAPLAGKPVLCRTVAALLGVPDIEGIVVTASADHLETYRHLLEREFPARNLRFTTGGSSRRASVYQGLLALPNHATIALIHDAARPLIQAQTIAQALQAVQQGALGSVVAIPVVDTLKTVAPQGNSQGEPLTITQTVDRSCFWRAQTPQVFQLETLRQAHEQVPQEAVVTDDAQLLELLNLGPLHIVPGEVSNLKITTPEDITLAEWYLQRAAYNRQ
ncbi:2-C-methyl-D-erythritol 4-phosphate cytidylyltransferase [Vampirovibrio chlorellavorus]|uniref:2-C-methyl-D-erythritol 4-phosphate cytidylyltransferase n=1 Tax=Vampirovibrio chlorellavorus TaxID=758823 RepID=UPI0026F0007F|nr:2-C-methyl-D-erythritol 4-phosphate cytidylyltransferase [Vampirovibrio chlorellavorus]